MTQGLGSRSRRSVWFDVLVAYLVGIASAASWEYGDSISAWNAEYLLPWAEWFIDTIVAYLSRFRGVSIDEPFLAAVR